MNQSSGRRQTGKEKPSRYGPAFEEYQFKLPYLAPIGFFLADRLPFPGRFGGEYETRIRDKILDLYGFRQTGAVFRVHAAQRMVMVFVGICLGLTLLAGSRSLPGCILGLAAVVLSYLWADTQLEVKLRNKKRDILIDLPEFINTVTLLVNAGLPFTTAVKRIARGGEPDRPLARELKLLLAEIEAGKPANQAYEDFAHRCKVPEVTRFVSAVLQNLNRGNADLVHVLRVLSRDAWERRKDIARRQGEEASTKLVFPMVLVFIAIALIVLAPAVVTMSQ